MTQKTFIFWIICILAALVIVCLPLCSIGDTAPKWKFYVMGVDVSEFRDMEPGDYSKMFLGAAVSLGAHVAGHYIAAEFFDVNLSQDGFLERIDYSSNPTDQALQWTGRGGFLFQLGINTLLLEFMEPSYFTKGYASFTAIELLTYPVRRTGYGDFNLIDRYGGDGDLEHFLYSTWAAHNLWRSYHGND